MSCPACAEFCLAHRFKEIAELEKALETARHAIAQGKLAIQGGDLAWDDYMECDLSCCACGQRFRLTCETFRGSSGGWTVV
jgi:hypothetical protein